MNWTLIRYHLTTAVMVALFPTVLVLGSVLMNGDV